MTYPKLSLLRYFVLTNCFFYAYSSNLVPKVIDKKDVPIDIYVLLDDNKIPELEKSKLLEGITNFLNNVYNYEKRSGNDAFGGTLIKCTSSKIIKLFIVQSGENYGLCFRGDDVIKHMEEGIIGLMCKYKKDPMNKYENVKEGYPCSKRILYESLLQLLREDFDNNYKDCLSFVIKGEGKLQGSSNENYKNHYLYLKKGNDKLCRDEFKAITGVKIFFKYKRGFNDFCKYLLNKCYKDFFKKIGVLLGEIEELKKKIVGPELNQLSVIKEDLEKFLNNIVKSKEEAIETYLEKGKDINFVGLLDFIEGRDKEFKDLFEGKQYNYNFFVNSILKKNEEKEKEINESDIENEEKNKEEEVIVTEKVLNNSKNGGLQKTGCCSSCRS